MILTKGPSDIKIACCRGCVNLIFIKKACEQLMKIPFGIKREKAP